MRADVSVECLPTVFARTTSFVAVLFACCIADQARASNLLLHCDGCSRPQVEALAQQQAQGLSPPATRVLYVVDSSRAASWKFELWHGYINYDEEPLCRKLKPGSARPVECETAAGFSEQAPEAPVREYASVQKQLTRMLPGEWPSLPKSAFEELQYPAFSKNVGIYLRDETPLGNLQVILTGLRALGIQWEIVVRVYYPDFSNALYKWDPDKRIFVVVPGSHLDRMANPIPGRREDVVGQATGTTFYDFRANRDNIGDFIWQLNQLGISVAPPNESRVLACSSVTTSTQGTLISCEWL